MNVAVVTYLLTSSTALYYVALIEVSLALAWFMVRSLKAIVQVRTSSEDHHKVCVRLMIGF